ncbi:MAG: hypothetical protein QOF69_647, partial [Solirubrobacteraceae bacterium]|nr:hypothetical protein [Solirubrobacteraceae bacterium]
ALVLGAQRHVAEYDVRAGGRQLGVSERAARAREVGVEEDRRPAWIAADVVVVARRRWGAAAQIVHADARAMTAAGVLLNPSMMLSA